MTEVSGGISRLAGNTQAAADVRTIASAKLSELKKHLEATQAASGLEQAHHEQAINRINSFLNRPHPPFETPDLPPTPPGSPIGSEPN